ncbi:hypothetical protein BTO04_04785 [Polaribacter sp. SA4-10]|uniref:hypothetical protein n=1 Tax=Polaribacter sp. SA4-10 TaxID=754397 RepID=UPI000B3C6594|nr:hypothetical protein [Polaribacter sp. SA4-10]ARV06059.1 hypothetical protein BTO04_04785 [Polaribacter sp. SA4-10]
MTVQDLVGTYAIIGSNQDADKNSYKGELNISLNENDRIIAKWMINNSQEQFGTGFFKDNTLVINFNYKGFEDKTYNGVVVYKCLNKNILEGFWSEEQGNPKFIGIENCFRIKNKLPLLN